MSLNIDFQNNQMFQGPELKIVSRNKKKLPEAHLGLLCIIQTSDEFTRFELMFWLFYIKNLPPHSPPTETNMAW